MTALSARFDPISTYEDWEETFVIKDDETGERIDLTDCVITLWLHRDRNDGWCDYWNGAGDLKASTDTGEITIPDVGVFIVSFMRGANSSFNQLAQGNYTIAVRIERDGFTVRLIAGTLPIQGRH